MIGQVSSKPLRVKGMDGVSVIDVGAIQQYADIQGIRKKKKKNIM
jgi:hypothetical protein